MELDRLSFFQLFLLTRHTQSFTSLFLFTGLPIFNNLSNFPAVPCCCDRLIQTAEAEMHRGTSLVSLLSRLRICVKRTCVENSTINGTYIVATKHLK